METILLTIFSIIAIWLFAKYTLIVVSFFKPEWTSVKPMLSDEYFEKKGISKKVTKWDTFLYYANL